MAAEEGQRRTFVLTAGAVHWAIDELKGAKIHPFFLAYLHLCRQSFDMNTRSMIAPHWDELAEVLRVPGGPPGKPYYRPFWNGNVDDPARYWLNPNIAGSYAPSSLRALPRNVVDTSGSEFALKAGHPQLALRHLLYDEPVSALALASFFYRNYGFTTPGPEMNPADLAEVLRADYRFAEQDFTVLFSSAIPQDMDWFAPFEASD